MSEIAPTPGTASRRQWLWLAGLVVVTAVIRTGYAWFRYGDIAQDGVLYSTMAAGFRSGNWAQAFDPRGTPLYPALVAFVHPFTSDVEMAGLIISTIFSTLTVPAAFILGQGLGGRRVAWWSALFVAFNQMLSHYGAEVLTEGTYTFWLTLTVAAGAVLVARATPRWAVVFGAAAGLAYLTRQEVLFLVALTVVAVAVLRPAAGEAEGRCLASRLVAGVVALAVFLAVASLQVLPLYALSGRLQLFSKAPWRPPVSARLVSRYEFYKWELAPDGVHLNLEVTHTDPRVAANMPRSVEAGESWLGSWVGNVVTYLREVPKMVGYAATPLLLAVWFILWRTPRRVVLLYVGVVLAAWFASASTAFAVRRYMAGLIPSFAACSALGLEALAESTAPLLQRVRRSRGSVTSRQLALVLGLLVTVGLFAQTLYGLPKERRGADRFLDRNIGRWMAANLPPAPLLVRSIRCGLYASFPIVPLPRNVSYAQLLHYADAREAAYLLVALPAYEHENPVVWNAIQQDSAWERMHAWPWPESGPRYHTVLFRRRVPEESRTSGHNPEEVRPAQSSSTGGRKQ